MKYKRLLTIMIAGLMLIGMTGCGGAATPGATEPAVSNATPSQGAASTDTTTAPATSAPVTGSGICSNPLFPVVQGATWTYSVTGAPSGPFSYTDTITDVREDGFTISSQFPDLTRTQEWSCTPQGLLALSLGGGNAGSISADGLSAQFTTSDSSGVTLPSSITPGAQWTNTLNIKGAFNMSGGQSAEGNGTVTIDMQEAGTESVSVAAGTFDATKVQATTTFDIKVTFQGISVPLTLTGNSTLWYAPGVGLVKSIESGSVAGQSFSATTELQSFNVPQ